MIAREEKGEVISLKISGESLKQLIAIRSERERRTGKIITMAEIVREAIGILSERGGSDEFREFLGGKGK